jgi:DNA-binding CsgD family transcriptional regulator
LPWHAPARAAERLGLKISTVRTHVVRTYQKIGVHTHSQLMAALQQAH